MSQQHQGTTKTSLVNPSLTEEVTDIKIIKVSPETHKELQKLGMKGDTFDDIVKKLIKEHKERVT